MTRSLLARRTMLAALFAATQPWTAVAATTPGEPKDVALRLTATGTVTAVDAGARRLSLKGTRGAASYRVDPKVQNLDAVKVGDRVKIDYVAALVLTLKRGGADAQAAAEREAHERASSAPGAVVATGTSVTGKVLAVDRAKQTVRLKGPEGRVTDFRVQDAADLVGVKAGDQVAVVLNEAVVVGLEPAPR
jgi:Cu/Ag efflux protein CusF